MNEECKPCWTRGNFEGEWMLSPGDLDDMFTPVREYESNVINRSTAYLLQYIAKGSMTLFMSTFDAYTYCKPLRERAVFKMKNIPWNVNLLNAFHNLHFTLFMADQNPVFDVPGWNEDGRPNDSAITVPAWQIWILQLVYKAATDCLRDDFIKVSEQDETKFRISTLFADDHKSVGMQLHVVDDGLINLWISGEPTVKKNGTFGFKYSVSLSSYTWDGVPMSMYGNGQCGKVPYIGPLKENMKNMKSYIVNELKRFTEELSKAEFNRPEYALCKINGGNL